MDRAEKIATQRKLHRREAAYHVFRIALRLTWDCCKYSERCGNVPGRCRAKYDSASQSHHRLYQHQAAHPPTALLAWIRTEFPQPE